MNRNNLSEQHLPRPHNQKAEDIDFEEFMQAINKLAETNMVLMEKVEANQSRVERLLDLLEAERSREKPTDKQAGNVGNLN